MDHLGYRKCPSLVVLWKASGLIFKPCSMHSWLTASASFFPLFWPPAFTSLPSWSLPPPARCFGWPDWHCCWLDERPEGGRVPERHVVQPRAVLLDIQWDHLRWAGQVSPVEELGWANTGAGRGRLSTQTCRDKNSRIISVSLSEYLLISEFTLLIWPQNTLPVYLWSYSCHVNYLWLFSVKLLFRRGNLASQRA